MFKIKHGFSIDDYGEKRAFYDRWQYMKTRCYNKNRIDWHNYGGRGITVCGSWLDFDGFKKDMYRSFILHAHRFGVNNTTLDRIDVSSNYSKENCRWATRIEQQWNRRNSLIVEYSGRNMRLAEVARILGRSYSTTYSRLKRKMPLNFPFRKKCKSSWSRRKVNLLSIPSN